MDMMNLRWNLVFLGLFGIWMGSVEGTIKLQMWKRPDFMGEMVDVFVDTGICVDLPAIWKRDVGSLRMEGTNCLKIYDNINCVGEYMQLGGGNSTQRDLADVNYFNRKATSVLNCDQFIQPGIPSVISVFSNNRGMSDYEQVELGSRILCYNFREEVTGVYLHGNCLRIYEGIGCFGNYLEPDPRLSPTGDLIRLNTEDMGRSLDRSRFGHPGDRSWDRQQDYRSQDYLQQQAGRSQDYRTQQQQYDMSRQQPYWNGSSSRNPWERTGGSNYPGAPSSNYPGQSNYPGSSNYPSSSNYPGSVGSTNYQGMSSWGQQNQYGPYQGGSSQYDRDDRSRGQLPYDSRSTGTQLDSKYKSMALCHSPVGQYRYNPYGYAAGSHEVKLALTSLLSAILFTAIF